MDDLMLINRALSGNYEASEILLSEKYDEIFNFLYKSTGNRDQSYKLTQDVLGVAFTSLHKFSITDCSFSTWVYKFAMDTLSIYYKSREHKQQMIDFLIDDIKEKDLDTYDKKIRYVLKHLEEFHDEQRKIILLYFYSGLDINDIAYILGYSIKKISKLTDQTLVKLNNMESRC